VTIFIRQCSTLSHSSGLEERLYRVLERVVVTSVTRFAQMRMLNLRAMEPYHGSWLKVRCVLTRISKQRYAVLHSAHKRETTATIHVNGPNGTE